MLSNRFTAHEAHAVSKNANEWIDKVDKAIQQSVLSGETEVAISLLDLSAKDGKGEYNEMGRLWYTAHVFFTAHYEGRGFEIQSVGQSWIVVKWDIIK